MTRRGDVGKRRGKQSRAGEWSEKRRQGRDEVEEEDGERGRHAI